MPKLIDITGRRYGELTVLERSEVRIKGRRSWLCRCDCGELCHADAYSLSIADKTCCGNHRTKSFLAKHSKPNPSKRKYPEGSDTRSRLWTVFRAMHLRCEKPSHPAYHRYGGRGITICSEWSHNFAAFSAWAKSTGYKDHLSLDRIDNDKGYSPENCRWATRGQQANNTRANVRVTAFGETKTVAEWARDPRCKVSKTQANKRIAAGHHPEFALTASEAVIRNLAATQREATLKARGLKRTFGRPS